MERQDEEARMIFRLIYRILITFLKAIVILLVVWGIITCCKMSYHFGFETFGVTLAEPAPGHDKYFIVKKNETMKDVAKHLEEEKLIVNRHSFYARTKLMSPNQIKLHPGKYKLNTSMDYEKIIDELTISE